MLSNHFPVSMCDQKKGNSKTLKALAGTLFLFSAAAVSFFYIFHVRSQLQHEFKIIPRLEIRLHNTAVITEGIGAVLSGLKPVLLLQNHTKATVTLPPTRSGHGYLLQKYIRFKPPIKRNRIYCKISARQVSLLLAKILNSCRELDGQLIQSYGVFNNCNTLNVTEYLNHPRHCVSYTSSLVRRFTTFDLPRVTKFHKRDICVLRRGGDVEGKILEGKGNQWAIDEEKTLPILRKLSGKKQRIILVTETKFSGVEQKYSADVFSNNEDLYKVVSLLTHCRCLFLSPATSFQVSIAQITRPSYMIHMESRKGFEFTTVPYNYSEFAERAVSILSGEENIVRLCSSG